MSAPGGGGHDRIARAFAGHGRRAAFMPYLMGGHPDVATSRACLEAAAESGADLIELGVPFSDPLADGPVIHAAGSEALAAGVTPEVVFGVCESVAHRLPVVLMVYANIVLNTGVDDYPRRAAAAGAAGLIVPDLPHEEAGELAEACRAAGISLVPLVAPTTPEARMAEIGGHAEGFVYAVSLTGTTGERQALPPELHAMVDRVKAATAAPVAVGFGISTADQASAVADLADGVIVGSRVVRAAGEGGPAAVAEVVTELAAAIS